MNLGLLFQNHVLWTGMVAWILAQVLKVPLDLRSLLFQREVHDMPLSCLPIHEVLASSDGQGKISGQGALSHLRFGPDNGKSCHWE